jgi:uncharacterized protein DUF3185
MITLRALGAAIAVAGGIFLVMGLNASDAPVGGALTGHYGNHTLWYIGSGLGAMIAGVCMALAPRR